MEYPMKKILVVDNDKFMLEFMNDVLSEKGHEVVTAEGGLPAVDILKGYTPDIIFVDLVMPNIDGKQLCRIIRGMPELNDVAIVVLSAIAMEEDINVEEFKADACLAKGPVNEMRKHILEIVDELGLRSSSRLAGETIKVAGLFPRNITKELLLIKNHFQIILGKISEGVLEVTSGGRIVYANATALSIIEVPVERLLGSHFIDLFADDNRHRISELMKPSGDKSQIATEEFPLHLNGHQVTLQFLPIDEYAATSLVILNDITKRLQAEEEKKKLEGQLQRAQKMEAIGTLAGGVAHDLNNILGGLVSYPELLLLQLPEDSPLRKPIQTIQKSGEKAAAVVQDLLTLARRGVVVTEVVNLNDAIADYLKSPEHEKLQTYHPGVHIETHLKKDTLNILGSSTHLSLTVMNLVSNAAEAMPEGGKLTLSTENRYIDRPISGHDDVKEGDYVVLTISDTGTGIPPGDMEKIFEPFYTKKKMGRSGTGLGMAVVWGTVRDHNGYIDLQSTEGKGTTFTLYFPVTREKLPEDKSSLPIESYRGNGESILIVDDVEEQRDTASGMLKELGYSVVSVSSGEEAVEYLKTNKVDLLLLDMIMDPGMDGLDTYKKILEIHPGQKAIIASGFSETDCVTEVQSLGAGAYIRKPFFLEKIGLAVNEELVE